MNVKIIKNAVRCTLCGDVIIMSKTSMRLLVVTLVIILMLSMIMPAVTNATEMSYGDGWVYDEAQVVSDETRSYIKNLNENVFADYVNKPQLAFIILNDLPYNIDDYKLDMFNEYGVGTKEENHGMLFVFAINDREYALEIGDGFAQGSILRNELETDFITEDMKNSLRIGDYDTVVYQIAEHLAGLMADEESGVYTEKEAMCAAQKAEAEANAQTKREQAYQIAKYTAIGTLFLAVIASIAYVVMQLIKFHQKERLFNSLVQKYQQQIKLVEDKEDAALRMLREHIIPRNYEYGVNGVSYMEANFVEYLYSLYTIVQENILQEKDSKDRYNLYVKELSRCNTLQKLKQNQIVSCETIINNVDQEEEKKLAILEENKQKVDEYWQANKYRIDNQAIAHQLRIALNFCIKDNQLLSNAELDK